MQFLKKYSRGDTVIEVLFAITVFSFIAVGGMSLMNKGAALAQTALEIGLVRQQIDTQADALRYLNRAYAADYGKNGEATDMWRNIVSDRAIAPDQGAQRFDEVADSTKCNVPTAADKAFTLNIMDLDAEPLVPTSDVGTYARVRYNPSARAEGIWIQAVRSRTVISSEDGEARPGFYDFHIRACWQSPGQATPIKLGTIVRLYEPRG